MEKLQLSDNLRQQIETQLYCSQINIKSVSS